MRMNKSYNKSSEKQRKAGKNYEKVKKSSKLGSGKRFASLTKSIESQGKSPEKAKAIAAAIGRKKYGNKKMNSLSQTARKAKAIRKNYM